MTGNTFLTVLLKIIKAIILAGNEHYKTIPLRCTLRSNGNRGLLTKPEKNKPMIRLASIIIVLLLPLMGTAQEDYVTTAQNDTLYGRIRHRLFSRTIKITTDEGKKKFSFQEYSSYSRKGRKYMHVRHFTDKGKELATFGLVISDGSLRLLRSPEEDPDYFLHHNGKFYLLNRRYFANELWKELLQCAAFAEKYSQQHQETGGSMIRFPKDHRSWLEMTTCYNQYCKE